MTHEDPYLWDPNAEPSEEVVRLETVLRRFKHVPAVDPKFARVRRHSFAWRGGAALAAAAVIAVVWIGLSARPWSVTGIKGSPTVAGDLVKTDSGAFARLAVGRIGSVDIDPGSELEIVRRGNDGNQLRLRYGTLHARIWAPPRFFVVETPVTRVIDLGCVYSLRVDSAGAGMLAVSYGEVELAAGGNRVIVAAGLAARIRSDGNIGLPYPVTASPGFRTAVAALDNGGELSDSLIAVLARERTLPSTATLWHLLNLTADAGRRGQLMRIVRSVAELPPTVDEAAVIAGDSAAVQALGVSLRRGWSAEPRSWWRRALVRAGLLKPVTMMVTQRAIESR